MTILALCLTSILAAQGVARDAVKPAEAATVVPPMPALVVKWVYPRAAMSKIVEQTIMPRERDVLRMHTSDPADHVEAFYRDRLVSDSGSYSVVSAVNQRIVANAYTVVTIESVGSRTVITVVANQPELEKDPKTPFPVKKGFRPPPS